MPVSEVGSTDARKAFYSVELETSYEKLLSKASEKAKTIASQVKVSTQLVKGQPADEIVNRAKKGNFDLIVMGQRGLGKIKRLVLGSVSNKVVNDAECQVLIVK